MSKRTKKEVDKLFLWLTITLVIVGFFIFVSASLGLYAREGLGLMVVMLRQLFLGVIGGLAVMWLLSHVSYKHWKKYALPVFLLSLGITCLVFVPGLGYSHSGATRWLDLGVVSLQPVELLKIGFVICLAAWFAYAGDKIKTIKFGILPFLALLGLVVAVLFAQPDTGGIIVIGLTGVAMFFIAGARWLHIIGLGGLGVAALAILAYSRPYIQDRLLTFVDSTVDPLGSGYQIKQSLIAVGSGEWFGRGFGQSIQKFNYVPEPIGDSIFAVFAEEWGFVGSVILILLFIAFALRGYKIAANAKDQFAKLLVVGLVTLIAAQSFVNIGALIGVLPLTGLPLIFVSHGGTAIFIALASVGIILNVSRHT